MSTKSNRFEKVVNIKNKKASFEFEFIDTYVAGLMLKGTEIKSIREAKVSLTEAYCVFYEGELFIRQMHISPYSMAASYNHEAVRDRKLLLNKKELEKLQTKSQEKGLAIIPVRKSWKSSKLSPKKRGLQSFRFVYLSMTVAKPKWKLPWLEEKKSTINDRT